MIYIYEKPGKTDNIKIKKNENLKLALDSFIEFLNKKYNFDVDEYATLIEIIFKIFEFKNKVDIIDDLYSEVIDVPYIEKTSKNISLSFIKRNKVNTEILKDNRPWYEKIIRNFEK